MSRTRERISQNANLMHSEVWPRRKLLLAALATPLALHEFPAAAANSRPLPDAVDRAKLPNLVSADEFKILSYASFAPSGHNTQPWTVHVVDAGHWQIGSDKQRWLPAVDPANRETTLSIGAFLENVIIAAEHFGYAVEYQVIGGAATDAHLIDVRLRKASAADYPMARLQTRRTVRSGYANQLLKREDLDAITDKSSEFIYFARSTTAGRYLADATVEANRKQTYRDPAQEELANWIRWSKQEQERFRNGLTPAGMEITGAAGWYVKHFYGRESVLTKNFREKGIQQVVERVQQGGGWLVLTGDSSVGGLIETGRRFQRMWLKLRERVIAIHPMTQILEEAPRIEDVARELGVSGTPQFLLRIGYVKRYPDPVSPRMPVSWFTSRA